MFGISIHDYSTLSNIIQLCQWFLNIPGNLAMAGKPTVISNPRETHRFFRQLQEFFTPIVKATRGWRKKHRSGDVPQQKKTTEISRGKTQLCFYTLPEYEALTWFFSRC